MPSFNYSISAAPRLGSDPREVANRIGAIYDRYDAAALARWSLLPGARALLYDLKRWVSLGLVSNVGRKAIDKALASFGLADLFEVVITHNDVTFLKPSGEGIKLALRRLEVQGHTALFIGDSVSDILAAKEAGVSVAIVLGGESDPAAIAAAAPTYLCRNLREVRGLFPGESMEAQLRTS